MEYGFDVEVATRYGVTAAVLLKNIGYWIAKNLNNRKHFHENRYWTYNSYKAFGKLYPFWTPKQIRTALDKLVEEEVLIKGNFNVKGYDKTNWYTIVDDWVIDKCVAPLCPAGQYHVPEGASGDAPEGNAIPDIQPYRTPDRTKHETRKLFFELYSRKIKKITGSAVAPPWGGKEGSLFNQDYARVGAERLRNSIILFFADEVEEVSRFVKKAGYHYNVFHGVLEKLLISKRSVSICPECLEVGRHKADCPVTIKKNKKRTAEAAIAAEIREENANVDLTGMFKKKLKEKNNIEEWQWEETL